MARRKFINPARTGSWGLHQRELKRVDAKDLHEGRGINLRSCIAAEKEGMETRLEDCVHASRAVCDSNRGTSVSFISLRFFPSFFSLPLLLRYFIGSLVFIGSRKYCLGLNLLKDLRERKGIFEM